MGLDDYHGGHGRARLQLTVLEDLNNDATEESER